MKRDSRARRVLFVGISSFVVMLGAALFLGLASDTAEAKRPGGPMCGPTYMWSCTGPGGDTEFAGTICDKFAYERATGSTCVPS